MHKFREARNDCEVGIWLFGLLKAEAEIRFMAISKTEAVQCTPHLV